eukprot:Nitzschia sp. Nitz4//scaffold87_size112219//25122//28676//NITZ4_004067-RA/size112219-processed-gene-0.3-mRNA-1//1//CDS//3329559348//1393//frame0
MQSPSKRKLNIMDTLERGSIDDSSMSIGSVGVDSDFDGAATSNQNNTNKVAESENRAVKAVRLISIFTLFCAIPLAVTVFYITKGQENDEYEAQFHDAAMKVLESIGSTLENSFGALDNFAVTVVTAAAAMNQTFPNIRVPEFSLRAAKTLSLSRAKVLVMCPLVTSDTYDAWTNWTAAEGTTWVDEALDLQTTDSNFYGPIVENYTTIDFSIYSGTGLEPNEEGRIYLPSWQAYPIVPFWAPYNFDYISGLSYTTAHVEMLEKGTITISNPYLNPDPEDPEEMAAAEGNADWLSMRSDPSEEPLEPASDLYFPIRNNLDSVATNSSEFPPVATFAVTFYWRDMFRDILPVSTKGVYLVVENPCSASFTYRLDGPVTMLKGRGDKHDSEYSDMEITSLITDLSSYRTRKSTYTGPELDDEHCPITFRIFPSKSFEDSYKSSNPLFYSGAAALICLISALIFIVYDRYQERRQKAVIATAEQSNAIVSSLFPDIIRGKILESQKQDPDADKRFGLNKTEVTVRSSVPIAELYTHTTVAFADISGFTAWASTRDASDVFTLLESIYFEFDKIARKMGVFKVETIGDSYVAVCGLPEPRRNHAVVMVRFCAACRSKMDQRVKELATTLGPGTETLRMRYGLNSGPTTAGVLRGDRSRFQLFGDTCNTASRMESTSQPNRIQATRKTADLLISAGKETWVNQRKDLVDAKGKGYMVTFWIEPDDGSRTSETTISESDCRMHNVIPDSRLQHLIDFNVEVLENLLKDLMAYNISIGIDKKKQKTQEGIDLEISGFTEATPREEIVEVITIPKESDASRKKKSSVDPSDIHLPPSVMGQIRTFVSMLAYQHNNDNPFHNFDHATHVAMSVRKLLARILKPFQSNQAGGSKKRSNVDKILQSTYVLTSDPMIQFAVYFSALIHDVDHPGVSNITLARESDALATKYSGMSCAEQNSVEVAWNLLMKDTFKDFRACIFADSEQLARFRQLVVNAVMATDVFDADLKAFREVRWNKVFPNDDETVATSVGGSSHGTSEGDLRATIVIEHVIQASDVVHTMQHWTVYQKWNRRLFTEMRKAYLAGRTDKDPAEGWYKGELGFFDFYIIPLAKKLKECGVFGVSCDEVLDYARDNRLEWEQKGEAVIREWMVEEEKKRDLQKQGQ